MLQFAISEEQSCVEKVVGGGWCWLTPSKHNFLKWILYVCIEILNFLVVYMVRQY